MYRKNTNKASKDEDIKINDNIETMRKDEVRIIIL